MIQDIRNLLLKESNRNLFFYLVAIAVVGPSLFVIFNFQKDKFSWGSIGSCSLSRKDFYLCYRDHLSFIAEIKKVVGEAGTKNFLQFMLGGLSDEQYVASKEIKKGFFLNSFFSSGFDYSFLDGLVKNYISGGTYWKNDFGLYGNIIENVLSKNSGACSHNENSGVLVSDVESFLDGLYSMKFSRAFFYCMSFGIGDLAKNQPSNISFNVKDYKKDDIINKLFKGDLSEENLEVFYSRCVESGSFSGNQVKNFNFFSFFKNSMTKRAFEEKLNCFLSKFDSVDVAMKSLPSMENFHRSGKESFEIDAANNRIISHSGELKEDKGDIDFNLDDFFVIEGVASFYVFALDSVVTLPKKSFSSVYEILKKQYLDIVFLNNMQKVITCLSGNGLPAKEESKVSFISSDVVSAEKYPFLFEKNFSGVSPGTFFLEFSESGSNVAFWKIEDIFLSKNEKSSTYSLLKKACKKEVSFALDSIVECFLRSDKVEIFK